MGNQSSLALYQLSRFSAQEWRQVPLSPYTNIKDPYYDSNFKVYVNKLNPNSEIEKYDLFFNTYQQFLTYKEAVKWRNRARYVSQIKFLKQPQKQQFCGAFYQAQAFLERTPIRLSQIQDISIQQSLCILYSALQGFQRLYSKYGYFQVYPDLIGFNRQGFIHVWLNKNFSKNYPEDTYTERKHKNYSLFVQNLVKMVEELTDFQGYERITEYVAQCRVKNPYQRMNVVLQMYAKKWEIIVPRNLNSIRNICFGKRQRQKRNSKSKQALTRKKLQSFQSLIFKQNNDKRLDLNRKVIDVQINKKNHTLRQPVEELPFRKTFSLNDNREVCKTSRTPSVRFHYRNSTLPSSPKQSNYLQGQMARNSMSTITSPERINSSQSLYCFRKNKRTFGGIQKIEIDPQIAADLSKITE